MMNAMGNLELFNMPVQQRNILLDNFFYDVTALTEEERSRLTPLVDREGTIIVVSPAARGREIRHYKNALRFMNHEGHDVQAIAVAGVGSSVLGTAALARNIADALDFDVAGIVTGYGMADLLMEAGGGWLFYGMADQMRHQTKISMERLASTLREPPSRKLEGTQRAGFGPMDYSVDSRFTVPGNTDVGTLLDILIACPRSLRIIVGHSKGSLLLSFVLGHFVDEMEGDDHPFYRDLTLITLGTVACLPAEFKSRFQFLGGLDWFGGMNSRRDEPHTLVPGAWHHLNSKYPYFLSVGKVLEQLD